MFLFKQTVEKMKARRDVKGLIEALSYNKDWGVCLAAFGALMEIGAPAVEPFIAALEDKDGDVRQAAARALVSMYHKADLSQKMKRKIFAWRDRIRDLGVEFPR